MLILADLSQVIRKFVEQMIQDVAGISSGREEDQFETM
jgi:hypothetical protein